MVQSGRNVHDFYEWLIDYFDDSISALQWLCQADKNFHNPVKRLYKFFSSLYACLVSEGAMNVIDRCIVPI